MLLWALAAAVAAAPAAALDPAHKPAELAFEAWSRRDGLPQNSVRAILQTADGYLWLGTPQGLARFDGLRFQVFSMENTEGLPSDQVQALLAARDGRLWVGTAEGLVRFDGRRFSPVAPGDGHLDAVTGLVEDRTGTLWIGTDGSGLWRREGNRILPYGDREATGRHVRGLGADRAGHLWMVSERGLFRIANGRLEPQAIPGIIAADATALAIDASGRPWIGTAAGLVALGGATPRVYTARDGLAADRVRSLYADRAGSLWVGTTAGFDRIVDDRVVTGERGIDVVAFLEDREGSLWIGSELGGLRRLRETTALSIGPRQGLVGARPAAVAGDAQGGLWVGTEAGEVYQWHGDAFRPLESWPPPARPRTVRALLMAKGGALWIGTEAGLYRRENGALQRFTVRDGLADDAVNAIAEDAAGTIWVGTDSGIRQRAGGRFVAPAEAPEAHGVTALLATPNALWAGGHGRLLRFGGGRAHAWSAVDGLARSEIRSLYEDATGAIWIATRTAGLQRLLDGRFASITTRHGLLSDALFQVMDDGRGRLWLASDRGLFRVGQEELQEVAAGRRASVHPVPGDESDGTVRHEEPTGSPAGWRTPDGRLWLATPEGLVRVDPADPGLPRQTPPVVIETVSVDGHPLPAAGAPEVLPRGRRYELTYTAPSFVAPQRLRFLYKLEGFDGDWVDAGPQRTASYTNLPPGRYRFRVRTAGADGTWSEPGGEVAFRLAPRFHETWWFWGALLLAVALLAWQGHRAQVGRLKSLVVTRTRTQVALRESHGRLEEAMETLRRTQAHVVQQERLRALGHMASGIAHDFNNALAPLVGFTEMLVRRPEKMEDKARLREYLKTIHTAALDAAHVVTRLREFYRHHDKDEPFHPVDLRQVILQAINLSQPKWKDQAQAAGVTVEVVTDLKKVPVIAAGEADLREALMNLIFNAVDAMPQGGRITLGTRRDDAQVFIDVRDTGMGMTDEVKERCLEPFFTTKGERGTGLGLSMVYGIVKRHGGLLEIDTRPGQGTTFSMALPLSQGQMEAPASSSLDVPPRPLRVLVIDDEPLARRVITEYLEGDGHRVETATTGREGLQKLHLGSFDLVVVDRAMPGMSGDQLGVAAKRVHPGTPVILLTGFGELMNASEERPEGVDLVLGKPATLGSLREAVRQLTQDAAGVAASGGEAEVAPVPTPTTS